MAETPRKPSTTRKKAAASKPVPDSGINVREKDLAVINEQRGKTEEQKVLDEMQRRVMYAAEYWKETFLVGQEDVRQTYIEQWPEYAKQKRLASDRPALSLNSLPQYIGTITSNLQQSTIGVKFVQVGGISGEIPGWTDHRMNLNHAEIMSGITRAIEIRSDCAQKYARGGQHAAEAGLGWFLLEIRPDPDDPFVNEIWVQHVRNRWSVLIDIDAIEPDASDMSYAFVSELIPVEEFNVRYPEHASEGKHPLDDYGGWTGEVAGNTEYWGKQHHVRVFDYYRKVKVDKEYIELFHPKTMERIVNRTEDIGIYVDELKQRGFEERQRKKFPEYEVRIIRTLRNKLLTDEYVWPGSRIPIIPVFGREVDLNDKTLFLSLIHYAIEPAQMKNMWASAATERAANLPKDPWILSEEQLGDLSGKWSDMELNNPAYLTYHQIEGTEKPYRITTTNMPVAELSMFQVMAGAIEEAIGIYEANLGKKSNETSGVAIEKRQQAGAGASFGFIYNVATAIRSIGEQFKELIPKVYNDDRLVTIITEEGEAQQFHVNHYITDDETGKKYLYGALSLTRYSVRVDVGPGNVTKREEFWRVVEAIFANQPQIAAVAGDLFIKALNLPYGDALVKRLRATLPDQFLTDQERKAKPPRQPTPEENIETLKLEAEKVKAEGDIAKVQGDIELINLKIQEAKQGLDRASLEAVVGGPEAGSEDMSEQKLLSMMRKVVAGAMREQEKSQKRR